MAMRANAVSVRRLLAWGGLTLSSLALIAVAYMALPLHTDWSESFRPAALELVAGRSPYNVTTFYNAPWALIPILPIAILPVRLGNAVMFVAGIATYVLIAYRLKAKPFAIGLLALSYPIIYGLHYGQIDWLASIGFVLPPPVGLLFLMVKPQIGLAVMLFWGVEAWRTGRMRRGLQWFGPLAIVLVVSFMLFGWWITRGLTAAGADFNTSLWPRSIPIGLVLLMAAVRGRRFNLAMMASPFLSPYLAAHSWSVVLLGLLNDMPLLAAASLGLWLVWLLGGGPPV